MKKVLFGFIAVLFISFSGFASNIEEPIKVQIKIETQENNGGLKEKLSYTINFETITDFEKFDLNQLELVASESCTVCANFDFGWISGSVCATASTCKRAGDMVLGALKELAIR